MCVWASARCVYSRARGRGAASGGGGHDLGILSPFLTRSRYLIRYKCTVLSREACRVCAVPASVSRRVCYCFIIYVYSKIGCPSRLSTDYTLYSAHARVDRTESLPEASPSATNTPKRSATLTYRHMASDSSLARRLREKHGEKRPRPLGATRADGSRLCLRFAYAALEC